MWESCEVLSGQDGTFGSKECGKIWEILDFWDLGMSEVRVEIEQICEKVQIFVKNWQFSKVRAKKEQIWQKVVDEWQKMENFEEFWP